MTFYVTARSLENTKGDAIVLFVGQENKKPVFHKEFKEVDILTKGICSSLCTKELFDGEIGTYCFAQVHDLAQFQHIFVVGLGDMTTLTPVDWQQACAKVAHLAKEKHIQSLLFPMRNSLKFQTFYGAVVGLGLGSYRFLVHKQQSVQKKEHEIATVTFVTDVSDIKRASDEIVRATIATESTVFVRDLVNESPSLMTPTKMASIAKKIAQNNPKITCTVFGRSAMKRLGMHGLLGVSQGSHEEPKFVQMTYNGGGTKRIVLVGKGITYDSGGLSLKPQSGLETMKCDMAGAATLLGVFDALAKWKPRCTIVGLLALCENMPGGGAIKPGDVVRAMNGKTIEVVNTDAEGRIILADALSFAAKRIRSDITIDIATLTGACVVALGEDIAGIFSDEETITTQLIHDGYAVGESLWRLPLSKAYAQQLQSDVADVRNVSRTKYGGAINGALFLKEFADTRTAWVHIDIAGPSYAEHQTALCPVGGTGFLVQTLLTYLTSVS